jgi:hypothetical protein
VSSSPQNYCIAPTSDQFLADYPEFDTSEQDDPTALQFSPSAINYWLTQGTMLMNAQIWGSQYYMAVELFMAHNLALEAWSAQGGDQTIPGLAKGMIAAASAGNVSVTYNNAAVFEEGAGHWNMTTYGLRLKRLIQLIAPAGLFIGAGGCYGNPLTNGAFAWSGPWPWNFPNPQQ